jgi:hypothetical protein
MQSLIVKTAKKGFVQKAKIAKKQGEEDDEVVVLQSAVDELKVQKLALEEEIMNEEKMYEATAKSKVERKLKNGVTLKTAEKNQNQILLTKQKFENKKEEIQDKIKKLEVKKEAYIAEVDAAIRKLENDIERAESKTEGTISYYQPLVDRCYEEVPLDIAYPPSHFKKKAQLETLVHDIASQEHNILIMKASTYNTPKVSAAEEQRKKLQAAARLEDARMLAEEEERRKELDRAAALIRKEADRAEEARAREQQRKHAESKMSYHQEALENSDYDSEGELLSPKEKANNRAAEERERLADELYAREHNLPWPPKK